MEGQETNQPQPETNNQEISPNEVAASENKGGTGALIASIIIIIIIIAGGFYFWKNIQGISDAPEVETPDENVEQTEGNNEAVAPPQPAADEISIEEIESDLENTDLDDLDAELEGIEAEFDAALGE